MSGAKEGEASPGASAEQGGEVKRLRALVDAAFEGLALHKDGVIVYANEALARMARTSAEQMVGKPIFAFAAPECHELLEQNVKRGVETPYEVIGLRADGTRFPAEIQAKTMTIDGETLRVAALRDLSERKQLEGALAEIQARSQMLFEKAADGIGIARVDGTIERYNDKVAELLGYGPEELVGRNFRTLVSPESQTERPIRWQELREGRLVKGERTLIRKDGSTVRVELNNSPLGDGRIMTIFRDVTERNELREQLLQAQKLESVGRLAGGIAHDFNNLLTVVLSSADMIGRRVETSADPQIATWARDILQAATRASELTTQLLTFSRKQVVERTPLDLNELIGETERLFGRLIGEDIQVTLDLGSALPTILANRAQMTQVVMNLVVNARDAMPTGGKLLLVTRAEQMADATPASWVTLTVSDTGSGMSKEVASRAFEPFFTTKPVGEGTGLGLTTAYGIVKHCDGRIDLDTAEGRGTTVRLAFPAHAGQEIPADKRTPLERPAPGTVIVLVEDEPAVAEVVRRMLQSVGYTVHVALAANDALRVLAGLGKVDLLITDVVMPEMNGHELARTVARDYPGLKVLYASGYAEDILSQRGVDERRLHFLAKPFSVHGLLEKVQDVLRS